MIPPANHLVGGGGQNRRECVDCVPAVLLPSTIFFSRPGEREIAA
jgi:hypothetical protein